MRDGHPPTQPAPPPLFSEETFGEMLRQLAEVEAGQRKCEAQNHAIQIELKSTREKLDRILIDLHEVQASQQEDDKARDRAATTWRVLRVLAAVIVVVVLPLMGWVLSVGWEQYQEQGEVLERMAALAERNATQLRNHEDSRGHEGLRSTVDLNGRQIERLGARLDAIESGQDAIREHTDEILRVLRRRRTAQ